MKKIVTVIGARPQFIKAAPVSRAFRDSGAIDEILVHTGQHYDGNMSAVFFDELEIPHPRYNLEVGSGTHAVQTGEIMKRLEPVLMEEMPDLLLIYGDTNSTVAGALTAAKLHIPVAHVEAGLRSFNRLMPEEINRIVADQLSDLLFAPTSAAVANLTAEGITRGVHKTGDVMYDAALMFAEKARTQSAVLSRHGLAEKKYALATIHRAENTDDCGRLRAILAALCDIHRDLPVVLPLHPRTKKMAESFGIDNLLDEITCIEPVGFLDMVALESSAGLIVTDSGGVQKEAYFHKVPCVTVRDQTEWVETVKAGWNVLASPEELRREATAAMHGDGLQRKPIDEYGTGNSARQISSIVSAW